MRISDMAKIEVTNGIAIVDSPRNSYALSLGVLGSFRDTSFFSLFSACFRFPTQWVKLGELDA